MHHLNIINLHIFFVLFQLLVVGGSFGLREFTQIRYDSQKIRRKVCRKLIKFYIFIEGYIINMTISCQMYNMIENTELLCTHLKGQGSSSICHLNSRLFANTPPSG